MGVDYLVELDCSPRQTLGDGDVGRGSARIVELIKARSYLGVLERLAGQSGQPVEKMSFQRVIMRPEGPTEVTVTYAEVRAQSALLDGQSSHCRGCPANFGEKPYGCIGYLNYPVAEESEAWLLQRVQPAGTVGGDLLLRMIKDFHYDGAPLRSFRQRQLFAAPTAPSKVVKKAFLSSVKVSTDQIWQALISVGSRLDPNHCAGVLVWLGVLAVDGQVPTTLPADAALLQRCFQLTTVEERRARAQLVLGPPAETPAIEAMHALLRALHTSFLTQSPLAVDA